MSKIPEDIRVEAAKLAEDLRRGFLDGENFEGAIGFALCAERERAVKIAKRFVRPTMPKVDGESIEAAMSRLGVELGNGMASIIADAIGRPAA